MYKNIYTVYCIHDTYGEGEARQTPQTNEHIQTHTDCTPAQTVLAYNNPYIHTAIHTYILTPSVHTTVQYVYNYIHVYIHIYIYRSIYTYIYI